MKKANLHGIECDFLMEDELNKKIEDGSFLDMLFGPRTYENDGSPKVNIEDLLSEKPHNKGDKK